MGLFPSVGNGFSSVCGHGVYVARISAGVLKTTAEKKEESNNAKA
jgi:hypothetical protein